MPVNPAGGDVLGSLTLRDPITGAGERQRILLIRAEQFRVVHRRQVERRAVQEDVPAVHSGAERRVAAVVAERAGDSLLDRVPELRLAEREVVYEPVGA